MQPKQGFLAFAASTILSAAAAYAGDGIDMNEPRRALGREDDIRVDAQLVRDTVSAGTPVAITYQIQNFTDEPIAIADKISDASYDDDTRTITLSVGAEVPDDGAMPHMVTIAAGDKKTLRASALPALSAVALRGSYASGPRFVQVKVTILRDTAPFSAIVERQTLSDALFDRWLEATDTIFLNTLPVHWVPSTLPTADVERRGSRGRSGF